LELREAKRLLEVSSRRPRYSPAADIVEPRRCTFVHSLTIPIVYWCLVEQESQPASWVQS
jgi:hypothetical protein